MNLGESFSLIALTPGSGYSKKGNLSSILVAFALSKSQSVLIKYTISCNHVVPEKYAKICAFPELTIDLLSLSACLSLCPSLPTSFSLPRPSSLPAPPSPLHWDTYNNNNNHIQRCYLRFFYNLTAPRTVSNTYAQVARVQPCANHVQHIKHLSRASVMLRATWYEGTAQLLRLTELKSHLFELYFVG